MALQLLVALIIAIAFYQLGAMSVSLTILMGVAQVGLVLLVIGIAYAVGRYLWRRYWRPVE